MVLRAVSYMQNDDLLACRVDRVEDEERVSNDREHVNIGFVGDVPGERKRFEKVDEAFNAVDDGDCCSPITFGDIGKYVVELVQCGLGSPCLHER